MKKPIIGIFLDINEDSKKYSYAARPWYALRCCYAKNVEKYGGLPIMLPYNQDIDNMLELIDGLIIPGSDEDIHPKFYQQEITYNKIKTKDERANYELEFTKRALAQNMPIFGICNGLQLINVIFGGSLIQHIPDSYNSNINHEQPPPKNIPTHSVDIIQDTLLAELSLEPTIMVNSTHHQAIDKIGNGLTVAAIAPDGIIEAVEAKEYKFLVGVQWHSEYLNSELDKKLFKKFINMSSNQNECNIEERR